MRERSIQLELNITFKTPFIVGSGFGIAGLVDSTTVKGNDNIIYLPASSLKGKIRSEFKKNMEALNIPVCNSIIHSKTEICKFSDIKDACVVCRIFGSEYYQSSLVFEDGVIDVKTKEILSEIVKDKVIPACQSSVRPGIKINRQLKTAEEGALFTLEEVNPAITLTTPIYGSCYITDDEYSYFKGTIETITHIGGNKAGGMGRCSITLREVQ